LRGRRRGRIGMGRPRLRRAGCRILTLRGPRTSGDRRRAQPDNRSQRSENQLRAEVATTAIRSSWRSSFAAAVESACGGGTRPRAGTRAARRHPAARLFARQRRARHST
jgi:hypothetical protein